MYIVSHNLRDFRGAEKWGIKTVKPAAEKLSALMTIEHLRQRAVRADRQDFIDFLEASPDVPPMKDDEIG